MLVSRLESDLGQVINLNELSQGLTYRGITVNKHRSKDLELGLSISNFGVEKAGIRLLIFVMKLTEKLYIAASYSDGTLVSQKQFKIPGELIQIIENFISQAKNIRKNKQSAPNLELSIQALTEKVDKLSQKCQDKNQFLHKIKMSKQYFNFKQAQKNFLRFIQKKVQLLEHLKIQTNEKSKKIMQPILQVEKEKRTLETVYLQYQMQRQVIMNSMKNLAGVQEKLAEQIKEAKKRVDNFQLSSLSDSNFQDYLQKVKTLKELQFRKKYLIK